MSVLKGENLCNLVRVKVHDQRLRRHDCVKIGEIFGSKRITAKSRDSIKFGASVKVRIVSDPTCTVHFWQATVTVL